jgi:hypothetical protein
MFGPFLRWKIQEKVARSDGSSSSAEPPPILMATVSCRKGAQRHRYAGAMARVPALAARLKPDVMVAGKAGGYHNATIQPPSRSLPGI